MHFTIVVDGFVIVGNKINMHVGGNSSDDISTESSLQLAACRM